MKYIIYERENKDITITTKNRIVIQAIKNELEFVNELNELEYPYYILSLGITLLINE